MSPYLAVGFTLLIVGATLRETTFFKIYSGVRASSAIIQILSSLFFLQNRGPEIESVLLALAAAAADLGPYSKGHEVSSPEPLRV